MDNATTNATISADTGGVTKPGLGNIVPAIVATVAITATVVLLIAGLKICANKRPNCKRSQPPRRKNESFLNICGHSTNLNAIVPVSSSVHDRAGENSEEAYTITNEHAEETAEETAADTAADESLSPTTIDEESVQQQTVAVEVHDDVSSNVSTGVLSIAGTPSTSSPQASSTPQLIVQQNSKPLRFVYETRNAIYDIA